MIGANVDRFALVTAAHHFLSDVLPFREPESHRALADFVVVMGRARQPWAEVDAVLLRCLVVLDTQHERRIPSLVDRYLAAASTPELSLAHFATCVQDFLRFRCIGNGAVQQAVDVIDAHYAEPSLDPRTIANAVGLRLSTLDVVFKRELGCTITEYVREMRLERSAQLLITTNKTVKEIWVGVGYNHPSNFDHEFKRRFGVSPREFRARSIRPVAQRHYGETKHRIKEQPGVPVPNNRRVLIVDDDECTRWTLSTHLNAKGYSVSVAPNGREGLMRTKEVPSDVILLDHRLGDMDGLQFLHILRGDAPGDVPAVALFTADWSLFDRLNEIDALHAVLASKLCDLDQVTELITCLAEGTAVSAPVT
jgi:AraC-like DNA-binding protein/CheY-like chemotaxis protein